MSKKATLVAAIQQADLANKEACAEFKVAHSRFEAALQSSEYAVRAFKFDGTCTLEHMNAASECADLLREEAQVLGRVWKAKEAAYFVAINNLRNLEKMEVSL